MGSDIAVGLVLIVAAGLGVLGGVAHWRGWRRPQGPVEPRSWAGRFYLTWPIWAALGCFGVIILVDVLLEADRFTGMLAVLMGVLLVLGAVTAIWQPEWFRPRWQRRHIELFRARRALIDDAERRGHHLIVVLTVEDDEEAVTSTDSDPVAVEHANRALADRPEANAATVLDIREGCIVRTIERELR